MGLMLRIGLLAWLLAEAESPLLRRYCADGEYAYAGQICCKLCPAGTHVGEHCAFPNTFGRCINCTEGKDYTQYENGLDSCLPCDKCKPGYMIVKPCTPKNNTECQCPDGYFCPPGCEECIKCKKRCPEGQVQVQKCSPTTDMECKPSSPSGTANSTLQKFGIIFGVFVFLLILGFLIYKKINSFSKREKEKGTKAYLLQIPDGSDIPNTKPDVPPAGELVPRNELPQNVERSIAGSTNEESTSGNVPSATEKSAIPSVQSNVPEPKKPVVRVIDSSSDELNKIYFNMRNTVSPCNWHELMRKSGLSNNDITKIKLDNPYSIDEAYYQMLLTLQDRFGIGGALCKLLDALWDLNFKNLYENVTNELRSYNIITLETKD